MKNFVEIGASHPWRIPLSTVAAEAFVAGTFVPGACAPGACVPAACIPGTFAPEAGSPERAKFCSTFPQPPCALERTCYNWVWHTPIRGSSEFVVGEAPAGQEHS